MADIIEVAVRFLNITFDIAWIGASFYFMAFSPGAFPGGSVKVSRIVRRFPFEKTLSGGVVSRAGLDGF
ncbi:MAG: hypothetical protein AABY19_04010 [Candidatus Thermoplasmatota archaeon]